MLEKTSLTTVFYDKDYFDDNLKNQQTFEYCNGLYFRKNCIGHIETGSGLLDNSPFLMQNGNRDQCKQKCSDLNGCVAFMHNSIENNCRFYNTRDVDVDCGLNDDRYTWYDMRHFEDDNVLKELSVGEADNFQCEKHCVDVYGDECEGITIINDNKCVVLKKIHYSTSLCHVTDTNAYVQQKSLCVRKRVHYNNNNNH